MAHVGVHCHPVIHWQSSWWSWWNQCENDRKLDFRSVCSILIRWFQLAKLNALAHFPEADNNNNVCLSGTMKQFNIQHIHYTFNTFWLLLHVHSFSLRKICSHNENTEQILCLLTNNDIHTKYIYSEQQTNVHNTNYLNDNYVRI